MRNNPNLKIECARKDGPANSGYGFFVFNRRGSVLRVQSSIGGGWDHVSVSRAACCPTWEEMCWIKEQFFKDDEIAVQLHVAKSDHINCHRFCLHLWRPQTDAEVMEEKSQWEAEGAVWPDEYPSGSPGAIPLPPGMFVGPKFQTA